MLRWHDGRPADPPWVAACPACGGPAHRSSSVVPVLVADHAGHGCEACGCGPDEVRRVLDALPDEPVH